ncbi:MAG TPA: hypothetical protein PKE29_01140 [Phycisphaerales bacterium]|nr:hypothetical protein [Phycisphaerales bacterium]
MLTRIRALAWLLVLSVGVGSAAAQPVTYYLRPGSTDQQGCFHLCACFVSSNEPLRGRFDLTPTQPDPVFMNFAVSNVVFRSPAFHQTFVGSGTYQIGGDPAALQRMRLDLSIDGLDPLHWDSLYQTPAASSPAINAVLTINNYECYDIVLTLKATPLRSDWNADGAITTTDIFDFLNTWLAGDGDANDDGQTGTADIFAFLDDWFAGR